MSIIHLLHLKWNFIVLFCAKVLVLVSRPRNRGLGLEFFKRSWQQQWIYFALCHLLLWWTVVLLFAKMIHTLLTNMKWQWKAISTGLQSGSYLLFRNAEKYIAFWFFTIQSCVSCTRVSVKVVFKSNNILTQILPVVWHNIMRLILIVRFRINMNVVFRQ